VFLQNVLEIPFNSMRRWQLVIAHCLATNQQVDLPPIDEFNTEDQRTYCVMMKGAPEVILNRCSHASIDGQIKEIDEEFRKQCQVGFFSYEFV
jgi:magnesium-transporting ATPase (P-type)